MKNKGMLIILSGPSGCGKGTMVHEILQRGGFAVSISATTRKPRTGEIPDVHYYFLSREEFQQRIADDLMLEHAEYCGNYYGTPREKVEQLREQGIHVILEIEVQGALQVKEKCPDAVLIFTMPPNIQELRRRLTKRGTETADVIEQRIARAKEELPLASRYDYIVINDALETAVDDFCTIIHAESLKYENMTEKIGAFESC